MNAKQILFICDISPYADEYVRHITKEYDIVCNSLKNLFNIPKDEVKHVVIVGVSKPAITSIASFCIEKKYKVIIDLEGCPKMCHDGKKAWIEELLSIGAQVLE